MPQPQELLRKDIERDFRKKKMQEIVRMLSDALDYEGDETDSEYRGKTRLKEYVKDRMDVEIARSTQSVRELLGLTKQALKEGEFKDKSADWRDGVDSYESALSLTLDDKARVTALEIVAREWMMEHDQATGCIDDINLIADHLEIIAQEMIYNRTERAEQPLENELNPEINVWVELDIDGFKGVNEDIGHDNADKVLQQVGNALLDCVRETDYVCRFGGDEFSVILHKVRHLSLPEILERIQQSVTHVSYSSGSGVVTELRCSIGVKIITQDDADRAGTVSSIDYLGSVRGPANQAKDLAKDASQPNDKIRIWQPDMELPNRNKRDFVNGVKRDLTRRYLELRRKNSETARLFMERMTQLAEETFDSL